MLFQYCSQNGCQLDFIVIVRKWVCVIGDDESDVLVVTVRNSRLIVDWSIWFLSTLVVLGFIEPLYMSKSCPKRSIPLTGR